MKKLITVCLLVFTVVGSAFAQNVHTMELGKFAEVNVYDRIQAKLIPADENKIELHGKDLDKVSVSVSNGTLKVKMNMTKMFDGDEVKAMIYYKGGLTQVNATEGAEVTSDHVIDGPQLTIKSAEGALVFLDVHVKQLQVKAVTGGKVQTQGFADSQTVSIKTGGQYDGFAMKSDVAVSSVSMGGKARVYVSESLNAKINMGGEIEYKGNPASVKEDIKMGGSVKKAN